jgi:hypothetical protein
MLLSHHQNAGNNHDIKVANRSFENVAQFKCLGATVTNTNYIQEEMKRSLNPGNACYHLVQNLLSSRLPFKHVKILIVGSSQMVVWQPRTRRRSRHTDNVAGYSDAKYKKEVTRQWDNSIRRVWFRVRCVPTNNKYINHKQTNK